MVTFSVASNKNIFIYWGCGTKMVEDHVSMIYFKLTQLVTHQSKHNSQATFCDLRGACPKLRLAIPSRQQLVGLHKWLTGSKLVDHQFAGLVYISAGTAQP